jgi:hypothetical protein
MALSSVTLGGTAAININVTLPPGITPPGSFWMTGVTSVNWQPMLMNVSGSQIQLGLPGFANWPLGSGNNLLGIGFYFTA